MSRLGDQMVKSQVDDDIVFSRNGFWTTRKESRRKRSVGSKDTNAEVLLRKALWSMGLRYRKNYASLPGSPDIAFLGPRVVVFVDGDFWHGRDWAARQLRLRRNRDYWIQKIERNMQRDRDVDAALHGRGWVVVRLWSSDVERDIRHHACQVEHLVRQRVPMRRAATRDYG